MAWGEYRRVHAAAAVILAPGLPPEEVEAALAEDWARDRAGAARLDYSRLFSAGFELADHWSAGIDSFTLALTPTPALTLTLTPLGPPASAPSSTRRCSTRSRWQSAGGCGTTRDATRTAEAGDARTDWRAKRWPRQMLLLGACNIDSCR